MEMLKFPTDKEMPNIRYHPMTNTAKWHRYCCYIIRKDGMTKPKENKVFLRKKENDFE